MNTKKIYSTIFLIALSVGLTAVPTQKNIPQSHYKSRVEKQSFLDKHRNKIIIGSALVCVGAVGYGSYKFYGLHGQMNQAIADANQARDAANTAAGQANTMQAQAQHANVAAQTLQAKLVEIDQAQEATIAATNAANQATTSIRNDRDDIARTLSQKSSEVDKALLLSKESTDAALEQTAKINNVLAQSAELTQKLSKGLNLQTEQNQQTLAQLATINSKATELTHSAEEAKQARHDAQLAVEKVGFDNVSRRAAGLALERLRLQISQIRPKNGRVFNDKITPLVQKLMQDAIQKTIDELAEPAQAEAAFSILPQASDSDSEVKQDDDLEAATS